MHTPQTIVIIGSGATARGLATVLSGSPYRVLLCGHEYLETRNFVEGLQTLNPFYDIEALSCSYEASWEADIIILAISAPHQPEVAKRISKVSCQKLVITIQDNMDDLEQYLPHSKIAETFSEVPASAFQLDTAARRSVSCPVMAPCWDAAELAAAVVAAAGFYPVIRERLLHPNKQQQLS